MYCIVSCIPYSAKFWWGKFWCFWHFPARLSKFNPSNCLKTIQHSQVHGERQRPSVKIFSIKYFEESLSIKVSPIKILRHTVFHIILAWRNAFHFWSQFRNKNDLGMRSVVIITLQTLVLADEGQWSLLQVTCRK